MNKKLNFIDKIKIKLKIIKFIKIDLSFYLIFVVAYYLKELSFYICYILFLLLHELSHYFMAKKLGYMAKNIKLSFFGASLEGLDDFTLSDEIKVILAGPMLNFISVIGCYLSFWFYPESYNYLYDVLLSNLAILFFNLMPIYPLDLGRIMLALFSKNNLRVRALEKTKKISYVFIIFLFFIFLITFFINYNFIFGFICVNLMSLHLKSTNNTSYKRELFIFHKAKLLERGLIERKIYLKIGTPDYKLFKFIDDYHFINFVFLDNNYNVKTIISELDLYKKQSIM